MKTETHFVESLLRAFASMEPCITLPFEDHLVGEEPILQTSAAVSGELAVHRLGLGEIRTANNTKACGDQSGS